MFLLYAVVSVCDVQRVVEIDGEFVNICNLYQTRRETAQYMLHNQLPVLKRTYLSE